MMIFKDHFMTHLESGNLKMNKMKSFVGSCMLLLIFSSQAFSQCLVWQDEFNTTSLDLTKWKYTTGNGCGGSSGCGFGNGELQYYVAGTNNITVGGGNLAITARYQPNYNGSGNNYTSGKISTEGLASWKYGRMEARIRVPSALAIWPAFWMLPDGGNWPNTGEIDIMETQNTNTTIVNQTIHYRCTPCAPYYHQHTGVAYSNGGTNWAADFHVYAVDWTPQQIRYSVDGVTTATYTPASLIGGNQADWPFDANNFFNILNLAVGGSYTGNAIPNWTGTQTMLVDYVRVYSNSFSFAIAGQKTNYVGDQKYYGITDAGPTATYNWTVPTGATIVSGQGTRNILVNYTSLTDGNIVCTVDGDGAGSTCTPLNITYNVKAITKVCGLPLDNFEGNRNLGNAGDRYSNGTLAVVANPGPGGSNTSATVGRYTRNGGAQYDILGFTNFLVDNADDFRTGQRFFTMDVRTSLPAGTPITIEFDNAAQMANAYPDGRHSQYTAVTGPANTWTKLTFAFTQSPDAALTAADVDRLQILFNPGTYTNDVFYFDNFVAQGKTPVTSAMTGVTTACLNQANVPYSVTNTAGSTYAWTATNGATIVSGQGTNAVTINFGTANSVVSVVETTSSLCAGTAVTRNVTVSGSCTLTPNFTATPLSTCVGNTIVFTNTTTGASGGETYFWDFGAGATPATSTSFGPVNVTYSSGGAKTISLTVTKAGVPTPVTKTNYINIANPPTTCLYSDNFDNGAVNFNASSPSFTNSETGGARRITTAGHGEWDTFTHTLNNGTVATPLNFSCAANKPVLKIRARASSNCLMRVTMVDGTGRAIDNYGAIDLALTTTYQTFTINYANHFTNTYGGSPGVVDSTNITQLLFYINPGFASFPVAGYNTAFNGTLDIDWEGIGNNCNVPGTAPTITSFTPTCGGAATSVTITGTNFTGATSVTFNGTAGTITSNNGTQLVVTAPAGVTAGPITVNTPAGSISSASNFTLLVTPSVSIAANPGTTICAGTSVTFTATPTNGGTPTYQWKLNGANVGTNSATYTNAALTNGQTVTVEMISNAACTSTTPVNSNTLTMVVTGSLTPSVSIAANPGTTICTGTSVTFTATPTNGGTPTYQWKLNGANVGTNSATYTNAALTNGQTVTVEMTSNAACASTTPVASNTLTMVVNPALTPSVSIAANPGTTICSGTSVTFTATPTNGGTPTYQWKLNGANVGTNSATYTNAALTNGQTVSVTMTSNAACTSTTPVNSNTLTMVVTGSLTPSVSIAANPGTTICTGTSVTFTATPTNGGTPTYQWKLNGANVGTNSATYTNAALTNGQTVTVEMTSNAACASTTPVASNTLTMVVNPALTPSVSIAANPGTTICSGTSVTFTATPTNGGTPTYQWKLNGANVGTNSATYTNAALTNGQTVSVTMTSNAACTSTTPVNSNTLTMVVSGSLTPSVSIAANPGTTICSGTSVTFTATPTNGGTPTYQWKLNGANVGTNSATYTNAALTNGQTVTVEMISNAACTSTTPVNSNTLTMVVTGSVTPSVSIAANPGTTICTGTSVTFTATPTNGGTPTYQWKLNGANVGTNSATYTNAALTNGQTVTVEMTSNAACASTTPVTSNTLTMVVNPALTPSVSIAANPGTTICSGTSVTFTATPTNGGTPIYQWKLNGANVGTNSATYTNASLVNSDQVTVEMTSNAACASTTPVTSNTLTITTTTSLTPSVSIAANPGTTICAGTSVTFTATPTNGGTPTYQWKLNGANVGTNSATYTNAALTNGQTVSVTMTSNAACTSTTPVNSNTLTITITGSVTPSVSIAANPGTTICSGTSVTFTATPTNGGTPTYQWKLNGANVGTNSATYTNAALTNGQTVIVEMTSNAACASTTPVTSNTLTMVVNPALTPSVSIAANPGTTICSGTSVTFTATPTNGGTPTYQWKLNGANVGTNSATYTNAALTNGQTVTVEMTSNAACASTTPVNSNTLTITTTTSLTPSVSIAANPGTTICAGMSVTFTATPTNGGTPIYQWKLNGANVGTNSATYTNASLVNSDQVTVEMTSNAACASTTPVTSNTLTITTTTSLTPSVSIAANPGTTICAGTSVTFTATPTNGGTPIYQWKLNGANVGTNSATYTNASLVNSDQVTVEMTSNAACASTTPVTSNTLTITTTTSLTPSVSIAANPGTTICAGTSVTFTATPTNGGTPTYQWKLNGANVGTNSATYTNAALTNGQTVTVEMTSNAACASTAPVTSNTLTMAVNPTPVLNAIAGTFTVTQGQAGVSYSVNNIAGATYNWTYSGTGGTITGSGSGITISYSAAATGGTLSVTATTTCGVSPASSQVITVSPSGVTPQPGNFTAGPATVCQNTSGVVYTVPSAAGTSYTWSYTGTGHTINGTGASVTLDFSMTATSGELRVVANNGSGASIPRAMAITVNAIATQPTSIFGSSTATQGQSNVAYFVPAQTGVIFTWSYTGTGVTVTSGQGSNAVTVNYSATATSGDIEVAASSTLCTSSALPTSLSVSVSPSTGIEDGLDLSAYGLKVYPNPAASDVTVEINVKNVGSKLNLALFDVLGNEVRVLLDNASVLSDSYTFSLEGLSYGVYFVRAKSGDETKTIKLIKY
jgi:hypothetical protein